MSTPSTELQLPSAPIRMEQVLRLAPSGPQLGLVVSLAAAVTLAVGLVMWAARPSMVPLDTALRGEARSEVVDYLNRLGQPYEMSEGMVLVPQEARAGILAELSAAGIGLGNDSILMRSNESGGSEMTMSERDKMRQAVSVKERELARTIASFRDVRSATVHVAMPLLRAFMRDSNRLPSASVYLKLVPGRVLDGGQVEGIVNLVARAVPMLEASRVSVVDDSGRQLNQLDPVAGARQKDLHHKQAVEDALLFKVRQVLDSAVGVGNYEANVDASIDFSTVRTSQMEYDGNRGAMMSEQSERRGSDRTQVFGVPGAPTNQPPEGGQLVQGEGGPGGNEPSGEFSMKKTVNMQPGQTERQVQSPSWTLKRIHLAVLIGDKRLVDDAGEVTRKPWEPAELERITELLKTTVGMDESREDKISVINQTLQLPVVPEDMPALKLWEQPWFDQAVKSVLAGLALLLLVLMVIRPTARALIGKSGAGRKPAAGETPESEEDEVAGDTPLLESDRVSLSGNGEALLEPPARVHGDILNLAREMATQDPKRVATVLKKWMDADE